MINNRQSSDLFDPRAVRLLSVLPDEDSDEAYCVRHDKEMRPVTLVMHTDGALYSTADDFDAYTCHLCRIEMPNSEQAITGMLAELFDDWDKGETEGDPFQYVGEGTPDDAYVYFES